MVAVVSGNGLGLTSASRNILGGAGSAGNAADGRSGEQVYVNSATGNLVIQDRDEFLAGIGIHAPLLRTYNSQGQMVDDNGDNWRLGVHQKLSGVTGTLNAANSTITKTFGDGADVVYTYNTTLAKYVATDGDGAHDTLSWNSGTSQWTWTDGSGRNTEIYDTNGRLLFSKDQDGNTLTYTYTGNLLTQITDNSTPAQSTYFDYTGTNLTAVRVISNGVTQTLTRYTYDGSNRLYQVRVDLSPQDNSITDGKVFLTTYTYDGTSTRIASIAQGDGVTVGSTVSFTYQLLDGQYRVKTFTDAENRQTTYTYTLPSTSGSGAPVQANANSGVLSTTETQTGSNTYNLNTGALTSGSTTQSAPILYSDIPVQNVSATAGTMLIYRIDVPAGTGALYVQTSGGTGDADLFLSQGTVPTPQTHDYMSDGESTNAELIEVLNPAAGTYYLGVNAWQTFTGATLRASVQPIAPQVQTLTPGVAVNNLYARRTTTTTREFSFNVPAGTTGFRLTATGPNGDIDIYVRRGSNASDTVYDYKSDGPDSNEVVSVTSPQSGTWYVLVKGWADTSDANLVLHLNQGSNTPPIVDAGESKSVANGAAVSLAGTASDAQGAVTYQWTQLSGTAVTLSNATSATATFTAPTVSTPTTLAFQLRATDSSGATNTDVVYVQVGAPAVGGTWSSATTLEGTSAAASSLVAGASNAGQVVAVWLQNGALVARSYSPATHTWTTATTVSGTSTAPTQVSLYVEGGNGNAVLVWRDSVTGEVRANRYLWNSSTSTFSWQGSELVASVSTSTTVSDLSASINATGSAAVIWRETSGTTQTLRIRRYSGGAWATAESVATSTGTLDSAKVAISSTNKITVAWRASSGSGYRVSARVYSGTAWASATQINSAVAAVSNLRIDTSPAGSTTVFWLEGNTFISNRYDGTAWGTATTAVTSPAAVTSFAFSGATDAGSVLSWTTSAGDVYCWFSGDSAAALLAHGTAPTEVTADGSPYQNAVVTWKDGSNIYAARFTQGAGRPVESIETAAGAAGSAYAFVSVPVGSLRDLEGVAVWMQNDGTADSVYTSQYNFGVTTGGGAPYYAVQSSDSWSTIAQTLYGSTTAATQLQAAMGNPTLTAGLQLTGLPASITVTGTTTVTVPAYYTVPASATWTTITQAVYGTSDANAVSALQAATGTPTLTTGLHLTVPLTLTYTPASGGGGTTLYLQTDVSDALGQVTSFISDAKGRLTGVLSPTTGGSRLERRYTYDTDGNVLTSVEDPAGLNRLTTYQYDANGNLLLVRDALGVTVTRTYSATNQLLTETTYTVADPDGAGSGQPSGALTARYAYDAEDHLRFVVTADGRVTEYVYNSMGLRTSAFTYTDATYDVSALAAATAITEAQLATWASARTLSLRKRTDFAYDFRGNLSTRTVFASVDSNGFGVATGASITRYVYDQRGQLLSVVDPRGEATTSDPADYVTTYTYDGLGRVAQTVEWLAGGSTRTTSIQYDDGLNKTIATSANGRVVTSVYNKSGDLIGAAVTGPASANFGTTTYTYDAAGQLRFVTDATGQRQHILYDEAGRKVATVDADGTLTELIYDRANQLIKTIAYADRLTAATIATLIDTNGKPTAVTLATLRTSLASVPGRNPAQDRITRSVFDIGGRLVYTIDDVGAVTSFVYDGAGRQTDEIHYATPLSIARATDQVLPSAVTVSTSANDRRTRHFYDNSGNRIATLDAAGSLVEMTYDAGGQLIKRIAYANATDPAFRASGTLAQLRPALDNETATDPEQDVVTYFFYDGQGRKTGELDGEGYLTEIQYDVAGNVSLTRRYDYAMAYSAGATVDALAASVPGAAVRHTTSFQYDGASRLLQSTNFEGTVTTYGYDSADNVVSTTSAFGVSSEARTTQARYDVLGRVIAELTAEGSTQITGGMTQAQIDAVWTQYSVRYAYDLAGRRISATDQNGYTTLFYYDGDGRQTHLVNADGEVSETTYDALGRITATRRYNTPISTSGLTGGLLNSTFTSRLVVSSTTDATTTTTYAYIAGGRETTTTTAEGASTTRRLNAFGDEYQRLQQIDASTQRQTDFTYDARGLLKTLVLDSAGINHTETYTYDAFGRQVQWVDQYSNTTKTEYDRLGRVIATVDPLAKRRRTTYDAFDRVLTTVDAFQRVTTYSYNDSTRSTTLLTPEGVSVTTVHNRHGQTLTVTDGNNVVTTYGYDPNGQLQTISDSLGTLETRVYDRAGRQTSMMDGRSIVTSFGYDAANRLISRTVDSGSGGLSLVTIYALDDQGRVKDVTEPNGIVTHTDYDRDGRVTAVTVDPSGANRSQTLYTYDRTGNVLTVTEGAGSSNPRRTSYIYDKLGRRIEEIVDPTGSGGVLNLRTQYKYDANGNVTRKIDAAGYSTWYVYDAGSRLHYTIDALGGVTESKYDDENRLLSTRRYASAMTPPAPTVDRVADTANPPVSTTAADRFEQHVYDRDGREVYLVRSAGTVAAPVEQVTEKLYDANGNVIRTRVFANGIAAGTYTTVTGITSALTAAGNSVGAVSGSDRVQWTAYDIRNRAIFTVDGAGGVIRNEYDGAGNVVAATAFAAANLSGSYDASSLTAWAASNAGNSQNRVTRTWYDGKGRAVFGLDAEGFLTEKRYDDAGRKTTDVAYAAKPTVNASSTLAQVRSAATAVANASLDQSTITQYDPAGRVSRIYDAEYSAGAANYEEYTYDAVGNKLTFRNKKGSMWTYEYDANHRLKFERSPNVAVTTMTGGTTLTSATNASLSIVTYLEYDALGNVTRRTEAYGTTQVRATEYEYDALGRQTLTRFPPVGVYAPGSDNVQNAGTAVTRKESTQTLTSVVAYDALGNAFRSKDVGGSFSYKVYDRAGRVQFEVDALNYVTEYAHDVFGNKTQIRRYANALTSSLSSTGSSVAVSDLTSHGLAQSSADRVMTQAYDRLNRLSRVSQPAVFTFVPNASSAGGRTITASPTSFYAYNAFGELIRESRLIDTLDNAITDPSVSATTNSWAHDYYYYDRKGQKTATVDALGYLTTFEYDETGDVTRQVEYSKALTTWSTTSYGAPVVTTRATSADDAKGYDREIRFTYDRLNRKVSETRYNFEYTAISGSTTTPTVANLTTTYGYDVLGNQTRVTDATGAATYTYYDVLGRVRAMVEPARDVDGSSTTTTIIPLTEMKRDAYGNLVEQIRYINTASAVSETSYTAGVPVSGASGDQITRFLVDVHGHVVQTQDGTGAQRYASYDALGNAAKEWQLVTNADGAVEALVTIHHYDALGHELSSEEPQTLGGTVLIVTRQQSYNAFGEIYQKGINGYQETFEYDLAGRLWRTNTGDGVYKVYLYDLAGNATADIRSREVALQSSGYATPDSVAALTSQRMRTETVYDLLGRVVAQRLPTFTTTNGLATIGATLAIGQVTGPSNPDAIYQQVTVDYGYGAFTTYIVNPSATVAQGGGYYLNSSGQYVLDSSMTQVSAVRINWDAPMDASVEMKFEYRVLGSTGAWSSIPVGFLPGGKVGVNVQSLTNQTFEYRVQYRRRTEVTPFGETSGTFRVDGATNTTFTITQNPPDPASEVASLTGSNPNAIITWAAPSDTSVTAVFRVKLSSNSTFTDIAATRSGGQFSVNAQSAMGTAGTYDYEVIYTRAGATIAKATGQLSSAGATQNRVVTKTGGGEFTWQFTVDSVATATGISNGQVAVSIASSASQNTSPAPTKTWSGTNTVNMSWLSIGSGQVKVELDYTTKPWITWRKIEGLWEENPHNPVVKTNLTQVFSSGDTGVTFSWSGANSDDSGGVTAINAVRVYKETSPGVWTLQYSQSNPSSIYGRAASWAAPTDLAVVPTFEYGPSSSGPWTSLPVTTSTSVFGVDLASVANGTYSYRITYRIGNRVTALQTGTLSISASAVTLTNQSNASYPTIRLNSTSVVNDTVSWSFAKQNASDRIEVHWYTNDGQYNVLRSPVGSDPNYSFTMSEALTGGVFNYTVDYFHAGETYSYATMVGSVSLNITYTTNQPTVTKLSQNAAYPSGLIQIAAPSDAGNSFIGWATSAEAGATIRFRYQSSGGGSWTELPAVANGSGYKVDLNSVATGSFNFDIAYTRSGQSVPYAYTSGTFTISRSGTIVSVAVTQNPPPTQNPVTQSPRLLQTLDRWGNVIASTDAANQTTNYRYNQFGQLIETLAPEAAVYSTAGSVLATSRARAKKSNYYDSLGRLIGTRDANNNLNRVTLNAAGQELGETHADGGSKYFVYDTLGRKTLSVDELGYRTWMTYDLADRLKTTTHEVSTTDATKNFTDSYGYDEAGRRISETNGENETTKYYYDLNGNLIRRRSPLIHDTTYLYDAFGHKTREQNSINGYQTWTVDYFGRITGHQDLGFTTFTYTFDYAGLQTAQTSSLGQSQQFYYDTAGHLTKVDDTGVGRVTLYDYDSAGRRSRERTTQSGLLYQDTTTTYDEQSRIATLTDLRYATTYRYDAQGNRTEIATTYYDHQQALQTQDLFYTYDSMNRVLKSQAANSGGNIVINTAQGVELTYDLAGQRKTAYTYGKQKIIFTDIENLGMGGEWHSNPHYSLENAYYTDTYTYDGAGRLTLLQRSGENRISTSGGPVQVTALTTAVSARTYDKASREITDTTKTVDTNKLGVRLRTTAYDDDSHLLTQTTVKYDDSNVAHNESIVTYNVDVEGVLRSYTVQAYNTTTNALIYTSTYTNSFRLTDSYVDAGQAVTSTGTGAPLSGNTNRAFNVNNELISYSDSRDATRNRYFANNANGQALVVVQGNFSNVQAAFTDALARRDNSTRSQYFFFANGQAVGSFGQLQDANGKFTANFDVNYTPVSADYPATTPSEVVTQQGDTLRTVAARVYGDGTLWYLIAEENGRTDPDAAIDAGSVLHIPIDVVSLSNASTSFKPFDVRDAIGDTTPTQPMPPPPSGKKGCGVIGQIIVAIVVIVVAYYTGIYLGEILGPSIFGTTAAAVGGAAAGNIAGQLTGMAIGQQDQFSWKSVAAAGLAGGMTAGIGAIDVGGASVFVQGAASSAVNQGVNIALGLQDSFSWRELAISAVSSASANAVGRKIDPNYGVKGYRPTLAMGLVTNAGTATSSALVRMALGGRVDANAVLADVFGNALGNSIVSAAQPSAADERVAELRKQGIYEDIALDPDLISSPDLDNNPEDSIFGAAPPRWMQEGEERFNAQLAVDLWDDELGSLDSLDLSGDLFSGFPARFLEDDGTLTNGFIGRDDMDFLLTAGGGGRVRRGSGGGAEPFEPSMNPRAASGLDLLANLDPTGISTAYRDTADAAAFLNERGLKNEVERLKQSIAQAGLKVPSPEQMGVYADWVADASGAATTRYNWSNVLNGYRDAVRLVDFQRQGIIDLDFDSYRIKTIGTAKLTPEQFTGEIETRYSRAFAAGVTEAKGRLASGERLPYPADMPKQLQVGLFGDRQAKFALSEFVHSIGVPEGPGQLISLNRWSYDPNGSGLYNRPDVLMNLGPGMRQVLDAKTSFFGRVTGSGAVGVQFENYYRYGATSVKVVTPTGTIYVPPPKSVRPGR